MVIEDTGIQVDLGGDLCTLHRSVPGAAGAPEDGARGTLFSGTSRFAVGGPGSGITNTTSTQAVDVMLITDQHTETAPVLQYIIFKTSVNIDTNVDCLSSTRYVYYIRSLFILHTPYVNSDTKECLLSTHIS